jgi:hypothetical protein
MNIRIIQAIKNSLGLGSSGEVSNLVESNKQRLLEMQSKEQEYYAVMKPKEEEGGATSRICKVSAH